MEIIVMIKNFTFFFINTISIIIHNNIDIIKGNKEYYK